MKKLLVLFLITTSFDGFSQIGTPCATGSGNTRSFFTFCEAGSSYTVTGNYTITASNNGTMKINGNVTINGTLTINMLGSASFVQVESPYTLTATNIVFVGSATGKNLIVDGPSAKIVVSGTLDFGGMTIDVDTNGTPGGSITAGTVTGGGNTTCGSDGSCPTFTATNCTGGGICNGQGLPITLSTFAANARQNKIDLSWTTETELNFNFFDLERSANGKDFFSIAKIVGHGTSNEKRDYFFVDEKPLVGKNYYRLKSVDFDNYTEYFKVLAVDFSGEKSFVVSPNPSDGTGLGFSMNFTPAGNSSVIIFDNLGNLIGVYTPSDYSQRISFTNPLKGGIYYAKIISDEFVKVERFVVR